MSNPTDPSQNPGPNLCHNCGHDVEAGLLHCSNCGARVSAPPPTQTQTVWPAQPTLQYPEIPPLEIKMLTKSVIGDRVIGTFLGIVGTCLLLFWGIGALILVPICTSKYRHLKEGVWIGMGICALILFGAFAYCMYAITYTPGKFHF